MPRKRQPKLQTRRPDKAAELQTRGFEMQPGSVDEKTRTVDAVLATEQPLRVLDRATWEPIQEVLRMDGVRLPDAIPLLADHNRYSVDAVLGSIRDLRVEGDVLACRTCYAEGDDAAERVWNKVRQGHLRDMSVGYEVTESTKIPPGQSASVGGRTYTAGTLPLRIATKWMPKEGSIVSIGADSRTKTRSEEVPMKKTVRKYLESIGLRADATAEDAAEFYEALPEATRALADRGLRADEPAPEPTPEPAPQPEPEPAPEPPAPDAVRSEATAAERKRIAEIQRLGDGFPAEMVRRFIEEGREPSAAAVAFLEHQRNRTEPASPAIHSRSHDKDATLASLGIGLAIRSGVDLTKFPGHYVSDGAANEGDVVKQSFRYRASIGDDQKKMVERLMAQGDRYRSLSLPDLCREAVRIATGKSFASSGECTDYCTRSAVSGAALAAIFTTNVNAQLLQGYLEADDTTAGWVSEVEVGNFLQQERASMGKFGSLTKAKKGGVADHLSTQDSAEMYRIARYTGQFVVDEIDLTNDRFSALTDSPREIGMSARRLKPNLVYAQLLNNDALNADSVRLFDATNHKNYGTASTTLDADTLAAGIAAMLKQRIGKAVLNLRPRFLLVPQDLRAKARQLLASDMLLSSLAGIASGTAVTTYNQLRDEGITAVSDDRIGVAGCYDPVAEAQVAGTATNWFLIARPGEEGAKTIEVGYLRGTGRAPAIRSFILDRGQWGIGWDVKHDIGAKALDFRAMYKATGAGS